MSGPDRLDDTAIAAGLAARGEAIAVEVLERCASTNTELLEGGGAAGPVLLLAEEQTAGRGRRGRRWHAPPGSALLLSLRWPFAGPVARLRGLSLATGVSIAGSLRALGAAQVALKWPNDLLAGQGKLGGILIETRAAPGRVAAVIGIGLNCRRVPGLDTRLDRQITALESLLDPLPPRNAIAARLVADLARALRDFDLRGFGAFRTAWDDLHAYRGERLRVRTADGRVVAGIAEGIAGDGALVLRNRLGVHAIASGSVVRMGTA
jgi:BirA family biotin operon repressor/biotin-[acetyl-CoA-carboxylase] ligase